VAGKSDMHPHLIVLGVLRKTIGLDGACAFQAFGPTLHHIDLPAPVFVGGSESTCRQMTLERVDFRPKGPVCFFAGIHDVESAAALRGCNLYIDQSLLPKLEKDSYYQFELIGMKVQTDSGKEIGSVESVENFPTLDSAFVRRGNGETMVLPLTSEAVVEVDRLSGYITVRQVFIEELL
jgi:16S rRNA processing protein RimM